MAEVGEATLRIKARVSSEAAEEIKALREALSPAPVVMGEAMDEGRAIVDTSYLRDHYADDEVIQAYADVIEHNLAIWEGIKRLMSAGIDLEHYVLRNWRVEHEHGANEILLTRVEFEAINIKEGVGGRPKR